MNGAGRPIARLTALLAVLIFLPLALLTYLSLRLATDAVRKEVEARLQSTASLSAAVIDEDIRSLGELVESYAQRPNLVSSLDDGDRRSMRFHLRELQRARNGIAVTFLARPDGRLIDIVPATPSIVGKDFSFRDWYRGLTATGRTYVSEAYVTQATGHERVVAAATFVRSGGRPVAILVAAYSLDHVQSFSDELGRALGVKLKVTDRRGVLVASSGGLPAGLVSRRSDPRVAAALAGRAGVTELDTPDGSRLSAYTPVPGAHWTVTSSVPSNTAFAAVGRLRSTVLAIAALLGLVLLGGLGLFANSLRQRRRAEVEARHQAGISDAVLEAATDGIALVDETGCLVLVNGTFERFLSDIVGRPLDLTPGQPLGELGTEVAERTTDPDAYRAGLKPIETDLGHVSLHEYEIAETGRAFLRYTAPVRDAAGELLGRLIVLREVTAEREAERVKSELVATVSHELRTPLTGILGFAELVRRQDLDKETRDFYLETIHGEAKRLTALVNDFLDLQRMEAGGFTLAIEPFDLAELLREQAELADAHSAEHAIDLRVPDEPLRVAGDRDRIGQTLANLLSNAVKYSPAGGEVALEAEVRNGAVHVSVADKGLGIPADQQRQIFTKFFRVDTSDTRRIGGTGLGLAVCREIVEAHGGRIGFESVEGKGSTFWFTLPAAGERRPAVPGRLLVIEDDPAAAAFLIECLGTDGHVVEVATTGEEGLARAQEDPPAAICLDIRLPGELDGWDVLERLKADPATARIPVIICTGRNGRDRAAALGAADFLTKPIAVDRLREAVARVVPAQGASVLVVDDDDTVRRLVAETLGDGYETREAADGEEALAAVAARRPDAIVLDLIMPGLDGFGVLERLQADPETRSVPVVVLTARRLTVNERRFLSERTVSLLEKSEYSPQELRRLVAAAVG